MANDMNLPRIGTFGYCNCPMDRRRGGLSL
jgi:hypothetical protein